MNIKTTISIVVEDKFGALSRIVELFSSRGYNLDSICSGECAKLGTHRITLVCNENQKNITRIIKLLKQIIYVHSAHIFLPETSINRELILARVQFADNQKEQLIQLIQKFGGNILVEKDIILCFELKDTADRINHLLHSIRENFTLLQISRTGEASLQI